MLLKNECLACCVRGSLDAARLATDDEKLQQQVVRAVLKELSVMDLKIPPPLMALFIHQTVEQITGVKDPYKRLKDKYNDLALELYPGLLEKVKLSNFQTAVRLTIAGNIIDFGSHNSVGTQKVLTTIEHALKVPVNGDVNRFQRACEQAQKILWLADNTGEIVFDKLLLSRLDTQKIIYAVRGGPTQNDATMEDAVYTGITKMVKVIDTGAAIPGVILDYCSDEFIKAYDEADLIISKGQGNFETLDLNDDRIFFLFKAKCPVVADHAGVNLHDIVILNSGQ
ncbi:MAG: ARMT1-like domain-containing protein [Pseudomonadota bacterium]